MSVKMNKS